MESLMLQAWWDSFKRVAWLSESLPPPHPPQQLTEDLLLLRRRPIGNQKTGQKEGIFPD